jgi:hypothetical protein
MNKIIYILPILFFISITTLHSQVNSKKTWNLSVGADFSFPENSFKATHGLGSGASFKTEYLFANHASLTLATGFNIMKGKFDPFDNPSGNNVLGIPLKAGLRYYLGSFYIGGEGGWINQSGFKSNNGFVYSFSIGDEIITNKKNRNSLDISFRHEAWITDKARGFATIRIAYEFRLR